MGSSRFSSIDFFGSSRSKVEELRVAQIIVDHHVRTFEALASPQGQEARISGPRTDEITDPSGMFGN